MENSSNVFADAGDSIRAMDGVSRSGAQSPMTRAAHMDLQLMSRRRVNLLLTGADNDAIEGALNQLLPSLREPMRTWSPLDPLELPHPAQSGTLILREVGAMSTVDQYRLLAWLESSAGRTQVVSTSTPRLLPLVEAGLFLDTLYYRLNIVSVDATA